LRIILTPETGPSNGAHATIRARDADVIPQLPSSQLLSLESVVAIICVSLIIPFGNIGLIGLSIIREVKVAISLGLASRFINLFQPIFPAA
jgi:hypothetical protein